jgi:2-polyprenyl-3-methyl-5-hydroxy-6-metoxy-1,4-benzoquinol methylase
MLVTQPSLYGFPTITSDCRPWPAGRAVMTCQSCGLVQRHLLPDAATSMADVYTDYTMFAHARAATDQVSFGAQGIGQARTEKILSFIAPKLQQSPAAVLDVGSGSGAGLLALAKQFPAAEIYGYEPNDKPAERQAAMPANVMGVATTLPDATQQYDLVSLFHVLEHVEDIPDLLKFVTSVLSPQGSLLIQVPYSLANPFDYVISDHVWHFSQKSLVAFLVQANFTVTYVGNDLIEKELTLIASRNAATSAAPADGESQRERDALAWLLRYKEFLDEVKQSAQPVAIYGTGPAGAWVGHLLGDQVVAYIDDDAARVDSFFNAKPVITPDAIKEGMAVIAPFPDHQFEWITQRNTRLNIMRRSVA